MTSPQIISSQKQMAATINRSPRFVRYMRQCGFKLPATAAEAVEFLRRNPHPCRKKK